LSETSEANNELSVPLLVQKLPTQTGLFLVVEDETNTARGGDSERVNVGTASIQGGSYTKTGIPVTGDVTVLARDIPVTNALVNYTISWQANGYAVPTPVGIGVKRNSSDPYHIDFTPSNTAVLKTNRWGSLSGTITNGGGATVRLVGQGLSIQTTADAAGNFSPTTEAKLGKLIPGEYEIRISKANYARLSGKITIDPLGVHIYNATMNSTTEAYLHGNVINQYGTPVSGAAVTACSATTQTDTNGVFDLTVAASCTKLEITRSGYAKREETLSLSAGLETLLNDLEMTFDPPVNLISEEGRVASRVINQSTGNLLPQPPEDANWVQRQVFEQFSDTFWPDYHVYVAYGAYAYNGAAAYSGPDNDRHMQFVQVYFKPLTFEVHALLATIEIEGVPVAIPILSDSGIRSAIQVIEVRLVNVKSGQVLKTVKTPLEGAGSEWIYDQGLLTYNFDGEAISDWENTEVWVYYKVGRNDNGQFTPSPLLYQHDRQIMKFDLSSGTIWLDYGLGEFPMN
ncbi:MAG: carboxypeptidase-like regulatory domain-containing protein, partial [Anaerolineales bacterium]